MACLTQKRGEDAFQKRMLEFPNLKPEWIPLAEREKEAIREVVATITAVLHPHDNTGYIHMVAAKPACRGIGIGMAIMTAAMESLYNAGHTCALLHTDDFRMPAIRAIYELAFFLWT